MLWSYRDGFGEGLFAAHFVDRYPIMSLLLLFSRQPMSFLEYLSSHHKINPSIGMFLKGEFLPKINPTP